MVISFFDAKLGVISTGVKRSREISLNVGDEGGSLGYARDDRVGIWNKMRFVPRSEQFDDVYFSAADGLAETQHVFIDGNNLPERWAAKCNDVFTICETGFGTGLNFLAALKIWQENKLKRLEFISFEKYPLSADLIDKSLSHWRGYIGLELDILLKNYPQNLEAGTYNIEILPDVGLTLIFGDVNEEIGKLQTAADCWFLDGFKPSSNPEMWSETVFQNMGRLSKERATFATVTSAGFVRRGLKTAGFDVKKVRGFGHKREMSVGVKL